MARHPDWFERLDGILARLQQTEAAERFGRPEIQSLFACSERDSLRLLHRFGAQKAGDALQLHRTSLLCQLETLRDGAAFQSFRRQQDAVAHSIAIDRPAGQARFRRIAGAVDFQPRRVADLPSDILLEPGRLEVRFGTEEDLWHLLDQLADSAAVRCP